MHRRMTFLLSLAAVLLAVGNALVGTWQLISDSPGGEQYAWTLVVKEENGNLSGRITRQGRRVPSRSTLASLQRFHVADLLV